MAQNKQRKSKQYEFKYKNGGFFMEKLFMKSMNIHISFVVMFAMDKVCDC